MPFYPPLVRLMCLYQAYLANADPHINITVADPFLMHEAKLRKPAGRKAATDYLESFMLAQAAKDCILLPYSTAR